MNDNVTDKSALTTPQMWRLFLRISPTGFDALLYNPEPGEQMRGIRKENPSHKDMLPAFEAFVYENPLLLEDFGSVTVLVETPRFALLPGSIESGEMRKDILNHSVTDDMENGDMEETFTDVLKSVPVSIEFAPDPKLLIFLRRTFHNPRMMHHLTPVLDYFAGRRKEGNHARTYVQIRKGSLDAMIFRESTIGLCNTFSYSTLEDATYFILASRQSVGDLDPDNDEIYICGDRELRLELGKRLEQFVKNNLPVIFPPSLFRKARNMMDMPFDLILMPLCE